MSTSKVVYVELPASSTESMKAFYGSLFGWSFQDWGSDYTAFSDSGLEGGFHGGSEHRTQAPLVVIETDALEAMEEKVRAEGGMITVPIFRFPGGRRFHFRDPSGNELAVMETDRS
jgi:uncharacterized protein